MIGVALTSRTRYLDAPGNVLLPATETGLPRDSVANVTQLVTVDEDYLAECSGQIPAVLMSRIEAGLRLVMDLSENVPGHRGQRTLMPRG